MGETPNRVCIIGAGSSGIAACKVLQEQGIPFDCFEASDRVGGNWAYDNPNNMSSAYKSLFINTSRERMQYSDYPMPESYPVFPHHTQIAEYFNNYVDHFNFRQHIHFNCLVTQATPLDGGGWEITTQDGSTQHYRALLVANGHHWDARWPDPPFPGHFAGEVIHSHYYREPSPYANKNVLVLGFGNSAMDIAVETSRVSKMTYLAVRRGFHIIPKYVLGRPLDQSIVPTWLPNKILMRFVGIALSLQVGKLTDYGLPQPDYPVLHAHPTVSSDILPRITHGRVQVKPNIRELDGDGVIFTDGSREQIDCIIYSTGYKVTFPFLKPEIVTVNNNDLPLFQRVLHPQYRDLFFIGLLQPLGAIMPLAEVQSIWISKCLLGEYTPPTAQEMEQNIQQESAVMHKRYGNSPRHTMQVDFAPYVRGVYKEIQRGKKRPATTPLIQHAPQAVEVGR
ncbi:MAG: flavin-containing monooxygenase [Ktedonobacteraceae bacterium]